MWGLQPGGGESQPGLGVCAAESMGVRCTRTPRVAASPHPILALPGEWAGAAASRPFLAVWWESSPGRLAVGVGEVLVPPIALSHPCPSETLVLWAPQDCPKCFWEEDPGELAEVGSWGRGTRMGDWAGGALS